MATKQTCGTCEFWRLIKELKTKGYCYLEGENYTITNKEHKCKLYSKQPIK